MKSAISVAALCGFLRNIGLAQVKPTPSLQPTKLGLSLSACKDQGFRFPDHRPSELAKVIGLAMGELQRYCGS